MAKISIWKLLVNIFVFILFYHPLNLICFETKKRGIAGRSPDISERTDKQFLFYAATGLFNPL